jgi:hypothetical protein
VIFSPEEPDHERIPGAVRTLCAISYLHFFFPHLSCESGRCTPFVLKLPQPLPDKAARSPDIWQSARLHSRNVHPTPRPLPIPSQNLEMARPNFVPKYCWNAGANGDTLNKPAKSQVYARISHALQNIEIVSQFPALL